MLAPALLTTRYAAIRDLGKVDDIATPVRISLGLPRFLPSARRWPVVRELCPHGLMGVEDRSDFERLYRVLLANAGYDQIHQRLGSVWREERLPLLLTCFEDCRVSWCHRTVFSRWWSERGGVAIPNADTADELRALLGLAPNLATNPTLPFGQLSPANARICPNVGTRGLRADSGEVIR